MLKKLNLITILILIVFLGSGNILAATTIEIWHRGDMAYNEAYQEIGERFSKKYPELKVNFVLYPKLEDKLITAGMSDSLPDAWILDNVTTGKWVSKGFVSKVDRSEFSDQIMNVAWQTALANDGNYYAIPWSVQGMAMYYRKDWFKNLDLQFPKTWDQLEEAAEQLTYNDPDQDGKNNTYGIALYGASTRGYGYWTLQNFLWQAGGSLVKKTASGKYKANLDTEATKKALKFLHDLVYQDKVVPPGVSAAQSTEVYSSFQNGLVGMVFHANYKNSAYVTSLGRANVGSAIMPAGPAGSFSLGEGENIYINSDSKKYKAVIKLAKFMTSIDIQKFGMQITPSNPVRLSVRKDIDITKVTNNLLDKPFQAAFLNNKVKYPEGIPDYYPVKIIAAELMQEVFLSQSKPDYEKLISKYNEQINQELSKQGILAQ